MLQPVSMPLSDRFTQRVPVSGHALVGVLRSRGPGLPTARGLADGTIAVVAPRSSSLCVRVTTQDGRYSAEDTFGQGAPGGPEGTGTATMAWPSQQPKATLDAIRLGELAVLVTTGRCGTLGPVLPATLGTDSADDGAFLHVLANSRGAATWAVLRDPVRGGPALRRVRCVRSETGDRVAFDVICPLGQQPDSVASLELRLEQQGRDGRSVEVVENVALSLLGSSAPHP